MSPHTDALMPGPSHGQMSRRESSRAYQSWFDRLEALQGGEAYDTLLALRKRTDLYETVLSQTDRAR